MADIDLQIALASDDPLLNELPNGDNFTHWVDAVLPENKQHSELTIRIVSARESQQLNNDYRQKDKPTNVLSFPADLPADVDLPLLGDLVICAEVVKNEAQQQNKTLTAHWVHMVIHGVLHLLGYDHIDERDAEEMEALETEIITDLGFADPYAEH